MDNLLWTSEAQQSYLQILDFIFEKSSLNTSLKWDKKVSNLLKKLSANKNLCPPSKKFRGLRRCTITPYTSILYRVKGKQIELITFFDNRSNHPF